MKLEVGTKVKFKSERFRYTVQASDERFAVCTKPFNLQHTVIYTIVDFQKQIRGPENLIFGMGAETRKQCEEMLDRLHGRCPDREKMEKLCLSEGIDLCFTDEVATEVSRRNSIPLDIESIIRTNLLAEPDKQ